MNRGALVCAVVIACAGRAVAEDKAVDAPVLDAARKAGFADGHVIARGAIVIVAHDGEDVTTLLAVAPSGAALHLIATVSRDDGELIAQGPSASLAAFLGRRDLVDVVVSTAGVPPFSAPTSTHYIVRAVTVELACSFGGARDTGHVLKDQRFVTSVRVAKVAGKAFGFEVASTTVATESGQPSRTTSSMRRYILGDTGACVEQSHS